MRLFHVIKCYTVSLCVMLIPNPWVHKGTSVPSEGGKFVPKIAAALHLNEGCFIQLWVWWKNRAHCDEEAVGGVWFERGPQDQRIPQIIRIHIQGNMTVVCKVDWQTSKQLSRHPTEKHQLQPYGGTRRTVRGSLTSVRFIIWRPWVCGKLNSRTSKRCRDVLVRTEVLDRPNDRPTSLPVDPHC